MPVGPQEYFVVYDIIPVETKITYPIGGETFTPGEAHSISWESYGGPENNFTVEYSTDNGSNWITIKTIMCSASDRMTVWNPIPAIPTSQALVKGFPERSTFD